METKHLRTHDRTYLASLGFADKDRKESLHDAACSFLDQEEKRQKLVELVFGPADQIVVEEFPKWEDARSRVGEGATFEYKYDRQRALEYVKNLKASETIGHQFEDRFYIGETSKHSNWAWSSTGGMNIPLTRSSGSIVGYIDLLISAKVSTTSDHEKRLMLITDDRKYGIPLPHDLLCGEAQVKWQKKSHGKNKKIFVEVKAGPTSVGQVIQQMLTYMHYSPDYAVSPSRENGYLAVKECQKFVLATLYQISQLDKDELLKHGITHIYVDPKDVKKFADQHGDEVVEAGF